MNGNSGKRNRETAAIQTTMMHFHFVLVVKLCVCVVLTVVWIVRSATLVVLRQLATDWDMMFNVALHIHVSGSRSSRHDTKSDKSTCHHLTDLLFNVWNFVTDVCHLSSLFNCDVHLVWAGVINMRCRKNI